jgi:hypothetical protein
VLRLTAKLFKESKLEFLLIKNAGLKGEKGKALFGKENETKC